MILWIPIVLLVVSSLYYWKKSLTLFFNYKQSEKERIKLEGSISEFKRSLDLIEGEHQKLIIEFEKLQVESKEHQKQFLEKTKFLNEVKKEFADAFKSHSLEALEKFSNRSDTEFGKREKLMAKLLTPLKEGLAKLDEGMDKIEKERKGESSALREQIRLMGEAGESLKKETKQLVSAFRKPEVRGMWGEMQLRRVIELSGMVKHCDFSEQTNMTIEEKQLRPDAIIHLPGGRQIVVDAKAPFDAFLEANATDDELVRKERLLSHTRRLKQHIIQLSKKSYWEHIQSSPEFVILFLPGEIFFSSALEYDPALIELGANAGVIVATPTTLIGLLKAIAYGWKQDALSKNAEEIRDLGHELYKRIYDMNAHFTRLGKSLTGSIENYNKAMGSFERRVLVSARKFKELGSASDKMELVPGELIEKIPVIKE